MVGREAKLRAVAGGGRCGQQLAHGALWLDAADLGKAKILLGQAPVGFESCTPSLISAKPMLEGHPAVACMTPNSE